MDGLFVVMAITILYMTQCSTTTEIRCQEKIFKSCLTRCYLR